MNDTTREQPGAGEPIRRRGGFGFALVLVAIGVAALLANLGYMSFSWGALLALWPLLLVIAGIDLLLVHRAPLAALALDIIVIGVGLVMLATRPLGGSFGSIFPFVEFGNDCPPGVAAESTVSVPKTSTSNLTLHLVGGAGTFTVTGGASDLVNATSDDPDLFVRVNGSDVRITECGRRLGASRNVRVRIADDVPVSLELTGGAGTFTLDLRSTMLRDLRATNGASTMEIQLPKPSGTVSLRLTGGASTITIVLGGAEASVNVTGGLTSLNAPGGAGGGTFAGHQSWQSAGYAGAQDRYSIEVTGGASTLTIR